MRHLVAVSQPGDAVFFHYSGHGGLLSSERSNNFKFKQSENEQTIIPVDYAKVGHINDFSLFHHLVQPMRSGVNVTCLMDCCYGGSILDLPYSYEPTKLGDGAYGVSQKMAHMNNLTYLYILAGGILPRGIFGNIEENLEYAVDGFLNGHKGWKAATLIQDTEKNMEGDVEDCIYDSDSDALAASTLTMDAESIIESA